jgi:hypothetical protein
LGADPHVLPRRGNDQIVDTRQGFRILHRVGVGVDVGESATPSDAANPGPPTVLRRSLTAMSFHRDLLVKHVRPPSGTAV